MSSGSPQRVLVVDDDRILAEMISRILAYGGYEVSIAATGEEAYRLVLAEPPALLVTDIVLPGIDGYTLCKQLRREAATRLLPILVLTSQNEVADRIAAWEAGVDDALTKPFQPPELLHRVRRLLSRSLRSEGTGGGRRGHTCALLGARGGTGVTTIATNLAVLLQQRTRKQVVLCDADFSIGDAGIYLGLSAARNLVDVVASGRTLSSAQIEQALVAHASGLRLLQSPTHPETGQSVTAEQMRGLLAALEEIYDLVIVDCQSWYDERTLAVLDRSAVILLIVTPQVGQLKSARIFLEMVHQRGIAAERTRIVLNRSGIDVGIEPEEVERTLRRRIAWSIPNGGRMVTLSNNRGVPLALEQPEHRFVQQVAQLADDLSAACAPPPD